MLLNLLGSGRCSEILAVLAKRCVVVEVTSGEVLHHPLFPSSLADPVEPLVEARMLERIPLSPEARVRFFDLIGAPPPDGLDDGEAAALAAGEQLGFPVAIDERKGRRIARERLPQVQLFSSAEVFRLDSVMRQLGDGHAAALFSALVYARMRVLPEHDAWVRGLLGPDRVSQCPSLRRWRR